MSSKSHVHHTKKYCTSHNVNLNITFTFVRLIKIELIADNLKAGKLAFRYHLLE